MIQYNKDLLEKYLAPHISRFTECSAPNLAESKAQASTWLKNSFLNNLYRRNFSDGFRQIAFSQIFRAQTALSDYEEARCLAIQFIESEAIDNPNVEKYFRSLSRWESCLINLQIFVNLLNKVNLHFGGACAFAQSDGTPEQRSHFLANKVKHFGSNVLSPNGGETVPIWLTNQGLEASDVSLTYIELADLVSRVSKVAAELQDAATFFSRSGE